MSRPESSPVSPPVEIAEKKEKGQRKFALVKTHIKGVFLLTVPGVKPALSKDAIEQFYALARAYCAGDSEIKRLTSGQKKLDPTIKETAEANEGLRGAQSEDENFKMLVIPTTHMTYEDRLLRESLGAVYFSVVHQDLVVSIAVPLGLQTGKGPIEAEQLSQVLTKALINYLGLSEDDLKGIMHTEVHPRVDVKRLGELKRSGQAQLLEGTEQPKTTWGIRPSRLGDSP